MNKDIRINLFQLRIIFAIRYLFKRDYLVQRNSYLMLKGRIVRKDVNSRLFLFFKDPFYPFTDKSYLICRQNSSLEFHGINRIINGTKIIMAEKSKLMLDGVFINYNCQITCSKEISIGEGTCIGPNVVIFDTDFHSVGGKNPSESIVIGKNVWIGEGCKILKGVSIGHGCVIACGSVVTHDIPSKCLAGGVPARVLRDNIDWEV